MKRYQAERAFAVLRLIARSNLAGAPVYEFHSRLKLRFARTGGASSIRAIAIMTNAVGTNRISGSLLSWSIPTRRIVRGYGAGRPIVMGDDGGRACPLRQLQETWGCGGRFRICRPSSMPSFGLGRCDRHHKLLFEYPSIFWTA